MSVRVHFSFFNTVRDRTQSIEIDEYLSRKIFAKRFEFFREINTVKVFFSKMASENSV